MQNGLKNSLISLLMPSLNSILQVSRVLTWELASISTLDIQFLIAYKYTGFSFGFNINNQLLKCH